MLPISVNRPAPATAEALLEHFLADPLYPLACAQLAGSSPPETDPRALTRKRYEQYYHALKKRSWRHYAAFRLQEEAPAYFRYLLGSYRSAFPAAPPLQTPPRNIPPAALRERFLSFLLSLDFSTQGGDTPLLGSLRTELLLTIACFDPPKHRNLRPVRRFFYTELTFRDHLIGPL